MQTVDFFTPIVDDPETFGAIAAANALSDVYAMGGRPISSLSILAYPAKGDLDDLEQILKGGAEKMREAGLLHPGRPQRRRRRNQIRLRGHRHLHPARVKANAGARAGRRAGLHQAHRHRRDLHRPEARHRARCACGGVHRVHAHAQSPRLRSDARVRRARLHRRHRLRTDGPRPRVGAGQQRDAGDRRGSRCASCRARWSMRARARCPAD